MKIGIANLYIKNGGIAENYNNIKKIYSESIKKELDIIIFPRLSLSGLCINNNFLDSKFLNENIDYLGKILDLTIGEKTKILIGALYYEEEYQENNNIYNNVLRDSVFFIDNGYIDTISSRKTIDKSNELNDYKYFDKDNLLKQFIYNKKKFSVLIADDIFSNFNVFLTSSNKPDYIICLDTSIRDNKEKHLLKLAKFSNSPVFYLNMATVFENICFDGEIILINEDFKISYNSIYKKNEILEFDIDCEDGTELFINKKTTNSNISYLLENTNSYININDFSSQKDIDNILKNKKLNCITFDIENKYNVKYINIEDYININLYNSLSIDERNKIKNCLITLVNKKFSLQTN